MLMFKFLRIYVQVKDPYKNNLLHVHIYLIFKTNLYYKSRWVTQLQNAEEREFKFSISLQFILKSCIKKIIQENCRNSRLIRTANLQTFSTTASKDEVQEIFGKQKDGKKEKRKNNVFQERQIL